MQRTSGRVIQGWAAVLFTPIALPIALIAGLLPSRRKVDRTPADVAGFLRDFADGTGGDWDWDEFESVPITDPRLDAIRRCAVKSGPPNADLAALRRGSRGLKQGLPREACCRSSHGLGRSR